MSNDNDGAAHSWTFCADLMTPRDQRNERRVNLLMAAWMVTYLAALALIAFDVVAGPAAWILAVIPALIAIAVVASYTRFLHDADELLRKIQTEALAIGFGTGMFFTLSYAVFERAGAPTLQGPFVIFAMGAGWVYGMFRGTARYR